MRLSKSFKGVLTVLFAFLFAGAVYGQQCTGEGLCVVEINGVPSNLGTQLTLGWSNGIKTSKTQVSIGTYKNLTNSQFSMSLDNSKRSQIVVLSDDCLNLFPGSVSVQIHGIISYQGQNFTSEDGSALVLDATASVDSWPPVGNVTYKVRDDVVYTNGTQTIVVKAGSEITMN